MNDEELERALQSVGKACFIRHVSIFTDILIDDGTAIERLKAASHWSEAGCKIRVSHAHRIVRSGKTRLAVEKIAGSRLSSEDIALARQWLSSEMLRSAEVKRS